LDLTRAVFDMFFVGINDVLLRVGLSILKVWNCIFGEPR